MDQAEPAASPPLPAGQAGQLAAFLRRGGRVAVLTGPGRSATREVLESALWAVQGLVIRTGNPLNTPLSLSRLMLQAGADPHADDAAAALLASMSVHAGGRARAVLAIDDAHTLERDALAVLKQLPEPGMEGLGIQFVFAGRAGLMDRLAAAGFERLDDPAVSLILMVEGGDAAEDATPSPRLRAAGSAPPIPPPPPPLVKPVRTPAPGRPEPAPGGVLPDVHGGAAAAALELTDRLPELMGVARAVTPLPTRRRRALLAAVLGGSAVGLAAGVAGLWMLGELPLPMLGSAADSTAEPAAAVVTPVPEPGEAAGASVTPVETPVPPPAAIEPTVPAVPADAPPALPPTPLQGAGEARLRRDFDAFLRHSGWNGAARTPEAREALFRDYKDWLARNRAGPAPVMR